MNDSKYFLNFCKKRMPLDYFIETLKIIEKFNFRLDLILRALKALIKTCLGNLIKYCLQIVETIQIM